MSRRGGFIPSLFSLLLLSAILAGCGGKKGSSLTQTCGGEVITLDPDQTLHTQGLLDVQAHVSGPAETSLLRYEWTITGPDGSQIQPLGFVDGVQSDPSQSSEIIFEVDRIGTYTISVSLVSDSCGAPATTHITVIDAPPTANAGGDQSLEKNATISLDGSGSSDPDGDSLNGTWALVSKPAGSTVTLGQTSNLYSTAAVDLEGTYVFSLTVTDPFGEKSTDEMTVTATDLAPTAQANVSPGVLEVGQTTTLSATGSDPENDPLTFTWSIATAPTGSTAAIADTSAATTTFTPDVEGSYTFQLLAHDHTESSAPVTATLQADHPITTLTHDVVAADYSSALDRLIMVSKSPSDMLYIYDPDGGTETSVQLQLAPSSVSVSPDGAHAAVGQNRYVTYVDLTTATAGTPIPVSTSVGSVALGSTAIYAADDGSSGAYVPLHTIDLATSTDTTSSGTSYDRFWLRLLPTGTALYGATSYALERFSFDKNGTAQLAYSASRSNGCGGLWFTNSGQRILDGCGDLFSANPSGTDNTTDLLYVGSLEKVNGSVVSVRWAAESPGLGRIAVTPNYGQEMFLFSNDYYALKSTYPLPDFVANGQVTSTSSGLFVVRNAADDHWYVIVEGQDQSFNAIYGVTIY